MNKILFINGFRKNSPAHLKTNSLLNEISLVNEYSYGYYEDIKVFIQGSNFTLLFKNEPIQNFKLVYFRNWLNKEYRDITNSISLLLDHEGMKYFDSRETLGQSPDKLFQNIKFYLEDLPIPKTCYGNIIYDEISDFLGSIFIMKDLYGSKGNLNFKIASQEDFNLVVQNNPETKFLFQEYLFHLYDYRILVYNHKAKIVKKRIKQDKNEHRANTSIGAEIQLVNLEDADKELIYIAEKASKILKRKLAGVDILKDENSNKYYIIEINIAPAITSDINRSPDLIEMDKLITDLINF